MAVREVYAGAMHENGRKARTESEWPRALEEIRSAPWQLELAFQPIFDVRRTVVWAYEALARFAPPPVEGPEAWFAAAGRHHVAGALESHAVRRALSSLPLLPSSARLAVNVTPRALVLPEVMEAFREPGDLERVVVELTEQDAITDYGPIREAVEGVRGAGALIAVDDVCSGHSGLRNVVELEPDFVKIDRPLVGRLGDGGRAAGVIQSVAQMCERIGAVPIAEGVERPSELRALVALGISLVQGYLIGHPRVGPIAAPATAHAARAEPEAAHSQGRRPRARAHR
jgi:EAL domain-containing protein (putative c-di-GMP-specific phosphodiesterase class I)